MALTKVSTDGVKDDAITKAKIPADQIEASELADNSVDTNAIQDQAVALSKLPHGTSSNDGKFLRANNGADPTFETVTGTTINNNADNRIITGSGTANTLNGESKLTFDGNNNLTLDAIVTVDRVINATDSADPWLKGVNSSNTETAYIKPDGQTYLAGSVGIGTSSPSHKLHVESSASGVIAAKQTTNNGGYNTFEGKDSSGNVKFYATHNGRVGASDGIIFGSDTAAANVLDDYEEGTWTPSPENLTNSPTYYNQQGKYVKIGSFVTIWGFIQLGSSATFSNDTQHLHIAGLPFAANDTTGYVAGVGPTTHQNFYWRGSTYNDYGANGPCFCGVANSTRTMFQVLADVNNGVRGTLRRKSLSVGNPILTWTISYRTTA